MNGCVQPREAKSMIFSPENAASQRLGRLARRSQLKQIRNGGRYTPQVLFYTVPWAMQNPGGGEVQLLKTAEYLCELGAQIKLFDAWSDLDAGADWLHLFGMLPECLTMARLAKRAGLRLVLSTVSWYDPYVSWQLEQGLSRKFRAVGALAARCMWPAIPSWRRELIQLADLLLPNSEAEAHQLQSLFGADPTRIAVIPNGVDRRFAHGDPQPFEDEFGVRDFVLLPGRIEPRKNQLSVIRALWGSGIPVVVLGDAHADHTRYYWQCLREADPGVKFVGRIDHDSPLLPSAYAAARAVVLASWFETPGLAALEGALAGAHVVVTDRGSAREYFGQAARYVQPDDLPGIRSTVRHAMASPRGTELRELVAQKFLWESVARLTLGAYERSMDVHRPDAFDPMPLAA